MRQIGQIVDGDGHVQRTERRRRSRQQAHGGREPLVRVEDVHARATRPGDVEAHVDGQATREAVGAVGGEREGRQQVDGIVAEPAQRAVDAHHRRGPLGQVQIARAQRERGPDELRQGVVRRVGGTRRVRDGERCARGTARGGRRGGVLHGRGSGRRKCGRDRRRRGRDRRRGRGAAGRVAKEHGVEPARGARREPHRKRPDARGHVGEVDAAVRLEGRFVLALEDVAEQLAQRVLRRAGDGQALGSPEGEHLRLAVGAEPEFVGALLGEDGEQAVDARHRRQSVAKQGGIPARTRGTRASPRTQSRPSWTCRRGPALRGRSWPPSASFARGAAPGGGAECEGRDLNPYASYGASTSSTFASLSRRASLRATSSRAWSRLV